MPKTINPVSNKADHKERKSPPPVPTKNMARTAINVGNRPLQGTKLLVSIAIIRSLGESIIRQPTIPAALHPNPIHIVKACFPQARHFLKYLSRLNAIRGKYPKSSNNVNKGKNIAMGGSMTEMTHVITIYRDSKVVYY